MSQSTALRSRVRRISARIKVGDHLMSGSDDPLFLGLRGAYGREFRVLLGHGKSLRRGSNDRFVFGAADDPETNVAHPEFNDPTAPPVDAEGIASIYLRKGFDPIPNVRAVAEMDDRLEILEAEIEIHVDGRGEPLRYERCGPVWLGLICGLRLEIPSVEDG